MSSSFITRVERDKNEPYTVIFQTDDADKYKHVEDECRRMIGHAKPSEMASREALEKQVAAYQKLAKRCDKQMCKLERENDELQDNLRRKVIMLQRTKEGYADG